MGFFDQSVSYEDHKYVMADTAFLYLGAKYSWQEMVMSEEIPFKLRTIFERYILPETDSENTLESELYYMEKNGMVFKTFRQLKAKVKFSQRDGRGTFKQKSLGIEEFCSMSAEQKKREQIVIHELGISKLSLMVFSV